MSCKQNDIWEETQKEIAEEKIDLKKQIDNIKFPNITKEDELDYQDWTADQYYQKLGLI
jgi:hypothetical protein